MIRAKLLNSAIEDIRWGKAHYRKINPKLARRFQLAVEQAVNAATNQPFAMQSLDYGIRRWPLKGFPHGILYRVEKESVLVLSVFHPSRNPEKWRSLARE